MDSPLLSRVMFSGTDSPVNRGPSQFSVHDRQTIFRYTYRSIIDVIGWRLRKKLTITKHVWYVKVD
jgi:hypothetical protein